MTCELCPRVAIYSHDTMGLGHLRRNHLIALKLAASPLSADVFLISGVCESQRFSLPKGVDWLTLPALEKTESGDYTARRFRTSAENVAALRQSIIASALGAFAPDVFIVDHVPRGALGELDASLASLKRSGRTRIVLGLRDIGDEPNAVRAEWHAAENERSIEDYYDAVWVYGDPVVYNRVREDGFGASVESRAQFVGYLDQRERPQAVSAGDAVELADVLVDAPGELVVGLVGGGQDGAHLADAFARAELPPLARAVLLIGPYLPAHARQQLQALAARRPAFKVIEFLSEPSALVGAADRIVSMGGHNTVSEILSYGKAALVVPRTSPRREQLLRARRLADLGLLDFVVPEELSPQTVTNWLARPAKRITDASHRVDLGALERIPTLVRQLVNGGMQ